MGGGDRRTLKACGRMECYCYYSMRMCSVFLTQKWTKSSSLGCAHAPSPHANQGAFICAYCWGARPFFALYWLGLTRRVDPARAAAGTQDRLTVGPRRGSLMA